MNEKAKVAVTGVVGLLIGAAGGAGWGVMQVQAAHDETAAVTQQKNDAEQNASRLRMANQNAVKKWSADLGKLVSAAPVTQPPAADAGAATPVAAPGATAPAAPAPAVAAPADPAPLMDGARAIVAARDGVRATLDGARAALDGDFDALAAELGQPVPDPAKVNALVLTLQQNWPHKDQDLQAASQQLLTDMGVLPAAPKPAAPAAAPAAEAPAAPVAAAPAPAAAPAGAQKK